VWMPPRTIFLIVWGFFATVRVFLLCRITRALAWPFCPIYPIGCFNFRLENSGELLGLTCRDIPTMVQCLLQDLTDDMHPLIGCPLSHTKLTGEHFWQGRDFHIIEDEEQLVLSSDQGRL